MASTPSKADFDAEEKYLDIQKQIEEIGYEFDEFMNIEKQEKHEDFLKIKNSLRVYHDIIVDELNEESDIFEDHFNENENTERLSEHIKTYNSFLEMTEALESISRSLDSLNIVDNIIDEEFNSLEYSDNEKNLDDYSGSDPEESEKSGFELTLFVECACCNSFSGTLIKCTYCKRNFHNDCHIPAVIKNLDIDEWKCTICQDILKYSKVLNLKDSTSFIPIGLAKRKIMERILMEFYCQKISAEKFRTSSLKGMICSDYYNVYEPFDLSLNVIKERLESGLSYSSLIHFLIDMRRLFSNAILYHVSGDPYYDSAVHLQNHLETLITKWIPANGLNNKKIVEI